MESESNDDSDSDYYQLEERVLEDSDSEVEMGYIDMKDEYDQVKHPIHILVWSSFASHINEKEWI